MRSGASVDQLSGDAHPTSALAHRAFEHITDAKLPPDLLHINGLAFVGKTGIPRDDKKPTDARERGDDLLDHTVGEIFLFRVAAHIGEWQHRDRRLVGSCRALLRSATIARRFSRTEQAIAAPPDRYDPVLPVTVFLEYLAQRRDVDVDIAFLDDDAGPHPRHQLVFGDDRTLGRRQYAEDVERPAAEPHRLVVAAQLASARSGLAHATLTAS
jgi:hypothetical protein